MRGPDLRGGGDEEEHTIHEREGQIELVEAVVSRAVSLGRFRGSCTTTPLDPFFHLFFFFFFFSSSFFFRHC